MCEGEAMRVPAVCVFPLVSSLTPSSSFRERKSTRSREDSVSPGTALRSPAWSPGVPGCVATHPAGVLSPRGKESRSQSMGQETSAMMSLLSRARLPHFLHELI